MHGMMEISLSEEDVVLVSEHLAAQGFQYDEDFTALYGSEWSIIGLRLMTAPAVTAVAGLLVEA